MGQVMKRPYWIGAWLVAYAFVAFAGGDQTAIRKQVEASVLVTGTIDIEVDGSVVRHALDRPEKLDANVIGLIDRTLPTWRFEPIVQDGKAHQATAKMSLLIVADKLDNDRFTVRIRSANFTDANEATGSSLGSKYLGPPRYPVEAFRAGVSGTTYAVVHVDRQGKVAEVAIEQVNLQVIGKASQMTQWRADFAQATRRAARKWQFQPPTSGKHVDDQFWSARIAVAYYIAGDEPEYGQWQPYIPGPRQTIPWLDSAGGDAASGPDAMIAGGVYQVGEGLRLLTPLGEG
jgi:hypothetical protein